MKVVPTSSTESRSTGMSETTKKSCQMGTLTADENWNFCADGLDNHLLLNKNLRQLRLSAIEQRDLDTTSILSDYSELSGPVSQVFRDSGLTIIGCADLAEGNSLPPRPASVLDDLTSSKEVRKANLLSLAAEFAEVKRMDCDALPFDLHKFEYRYDSDSDSSEGMGMRDTNSERSFAQTSHNQGVDKEDLDEEEEEVWHLRRAMPERKFEINLHKTCTDISTNCVDTSFSEPHEAECENLMYRSERDRVLAELSLDTLSGVGVDDGMDVRLVDDTASMQMCFRNEAALSCDSDHSDHAANLELRGEQAMMLSSASHGNLVENESWPFNLNDSSQSESNYSEVVYETLLQKQARLQAEARLALAQARPMARMQLEVERQAATLRQRADPANVAATNALPEVENFLIGTMSSSFESRRRKKLHQAHPTNIKNAPLEQVGLAKSALQRMSLAQLQVLFNQLKSRVEEYNEDLVRMLMERDDAHMEQDSMLVDVEDLTRRAHEIATRFQESQKMLPTSKGNQMNNKMRENFNVNMKYSLASDDNKTVVIRVTESRVSALKARLRPNKLISMFCAIPNDATLSQLANSTSSIAS